jgi:hypothetical protein
VTLVSRFILIGLTAASLAAAPASQPATKPASQPTPRPLAGQVLGKTIYVDELDITHRVPIGFKFDASHDTLWDQSGRVMQAFGGPIIEGFKRDTDARATDEERRKFGEVMHASQLRQIPETQKQIAELQTKLADTTLAPDARTKLGQELRLIQQNLDFLRGSVEKGPKHFAASADHFIEGWKLQRNLHRKYGGQIIFQQFGPEALDGMRRLFEDAEKAGELRFDDPFLRYLFYRYYEMGHNVMDDATVLENPWFFRDPTTQPAE